MATPMIRTIEEAKAAVAEVPGAGVLSMTCALDVATLKHWRKLLPSSMTDPSTGIFRYEDVCISTAGWYNNSPLKGPSEFGSVKEFLLGENTVLADLSDPFTLVTALPIMIILMKLAKKALVPKFSTIGRTLGRNTYGPQWEDHNEDRIKKFGEYVFRMGFHTLVTAWGLYYTLMNSSWWTDTRHLYEGHPHHPMDACCTWYYLIQAGYNVDALLELIHISFELRHPFVPRKDSKGAKWQFVGWAPTCRGDFQEMAMHHVVVNALVFCSSIYRFTRIGSMVFLLTDMSDILVDMSKLANFLKWKKTTLSCFGLMFVVWAINREFLLPFVIWRSIWVDSFYILKEGFPILSYKQLRLLFQCLAILISFVHTSWFTMFFKMGWAILKKGETHDYSEHKQGEKYVTGKERSGAKKEC